MTNLQRLIKGREQSGLSIGQAAKLLGIERQQVADWELGVHTPSTEDMKRLSDLYDVNLNWLTGNDTGENAPYLDPQLIAMLDGMNNREDAERLMGLLISLKRDDEVSR